MKHCFYLPFIVLAFFVSSCGEDKKPEFKNYDLNSVTDLVELKLSDIVSDIRIVPLETKEGVFLPDCRYAIDDNYIVSISDGAIMQFDAVSGKYIRTLAVKGNGPNEFTFVISAFIKGGKLFFSNQNKSYISVIDLSTGERMPDIQTDYTDGISMLSMEDNGDIYTANDSLLFKFFNLNTKKSGFLADTAMMKKHDKARQSVIIFGGGGKSVARYKDERYYYNVGYSDTLYMGKKDAYTVSPFARFILPEEKTGPKTSYGIGDINRDELLVPYVGSGGILCILNEFSLVVSGQSITGGMKDKGTYYIDRKSGKVKRINKYIFDPLFEKEFVDSPKTDLQPKSFISAAIYSYLNCCVDNGLYMKVFPAYKIKEYINEALENAELSDKKKDAMRKLDSGLTEDSNPVVFIGKQR